MKKTGKYKYVLPAAMIVAFFLVKILFFNDIEDKQDVETKITSTIDTKSTSKTNNKANNDITYELYLVERVVDGDTVILVIDGEKVRCRISGVDTPESVGDYKDNPQYYGKEASDYTKEALENEYVYVQYDVKKYDKYDRLLAYIWTEPPNDEMEGFFNANLILNGYAKWYNDSNNKLYADLFREFEQYAKDNKLGLWQRE